MNKPLAISSLLPVSEDVNQTKCMEATKESWQGTVVESHISLYDET